MDKEKPKIFISHSWEDNEISRKLAEYLIRDGADVWIDYARISGGDSLPRRISEALEWCDTLVLLWSKSAASSYYVNLEWENALDLKKNIIPCLIDETKRPSILHRCLYIDLKDIEQGYINLAKTLRLEIKEETQKIKNKKINEIDKSEKAEKWTEVETLIEAEKKENKPNKGEITKDKIVSEKEIKRYPKINKKWYSSKSSYRIKYKIRCGYYIQYRDWKTLWIWTNIGTLHENKFYTMYYSTFEEAQNKVKKLSWENAQEKIVTLYKS